MRSARVTLCGLTARRRRCSLVQRQYWAKRSAFTDGWATRSAIAGSPRLIWFKPPLLDLAVVHPYTRCRGCVRAHTRMSSWLFCGQTEDRLQLWDSLG